MELKFITGYSRSTRSHWQGNVLNYPDTFAAVRPYTDVHGTIGWATDGDLHQIRTYNAKKKSFVDLKVIGKYHKVEKFDIQHLPITTHHRIKQKIHGDVYYLSTNNGKVFITGSYGHSDYDIIAKIRSNMNFKYMIDKHCKGNTSIELVYSNKEFWLTNICTAEKIVDWKDVERIGEYFNIRTPKLLSSRLLQYDPALMDYFYSDYHFNDADYIPTKEYIVMFEFRNKQYLFCKI